MRRHTWTFAVVVREDTREGAEFPSPFNPGQSYER